jgi:hypothetical protein
MIPTMANTRYIRNSRGQVIGRIDEQATQTVYSNVNGRVVARVISNRTIDAAGNFIGFGDQGMGLLYKSIN